MTATLKPTKRTTAAGQPDAGTHVSAARRRRTKPRAGIPLSPVWDASAASNVIASPENGLPNRVTLTDPALSGECEAIRVLRRQYVRAVRDLLRLDNSMRSAIGGLLGFRVDMEKKQADALFGLARALMDAFASDKPPPEGMEKITEVLLLPLLAWREGRKPYANLAKDLMKQMTVKAERLPAAAWVKSVKGFGLGNFANIVGECGDLSNYASPAKVWKRLGLAPLNGRAASTWRLKGGLTADEWVALGYSPARRSCVFNLGASLMKGNGEDGCFKKVYADRKAYEMARDPSMSKGYAHARAQRYMEKRAVRELWRAWCDVTNGRPRGQSDTDPH